MDASRAGWWGLAVGGVLALSWTGCRSAGPGTADRPGDAGGQQDAPPEARDWSPEQMEERARRHAHFAAGVLTELQNEPAASLDHFVAAAEADPLNETLMLQVAGRLLRAQAAERAEALLAKAARNPDAPASYLSWRALALQQQGKTDEAIQANRDALRRNPALLMAWQHLVAIYSERQQTDELFALLTEAASQTSQDPNYLVTIADLHLAAAHLHPTRLDSVKPRCRELLDRAAELPLDDPVLAHRLAGAYRQIGEMQRAEDIYLKILERNPSAPLVRENLVDIYLTTSNREAAARQLRSLIEADPTNERATYLLGALAFQENRLEEAEDYLEKALLLQPLFEPAYYDLAGVKLSRDKPEEALALLDRARGRFPRAFLLEFYSGLAHARAKRYAEAVRHYTEAEALAATGERSRLNHVFYFQYGVACERKGDFAEAEQHMRKAIELAPTFAEALNYLGYMWADRGEKLDEARALIERALAIEPDNGAYLDSMAWVLFKQGKAPEALEWMLKAIQHVEEEEEDATLYDHLGDVYQALGEAAKAREAWERSLAIESSEAVRKKLESPAAPPVREPGAPAQ